MNLVKKFYEQLPFNKTSENVYKQQTRQLYTPWPELNDCLNDSHSVLELGCGTGWLTNRIANSWDLLSVTGIDLIPENVKWANKYSTGAKFYTENLLNTKRNADTVISIGVLHHIEEDTKSLIKQCVERANKYAFIGLYYEPSRSAMQEYFNQLPEKNRYKVFKKLTPWIVNETQRKSWYRDQFEHPYECSVTLDDFDIGVKHTCFGHYDRNETLRRLTNGEFVSGFVYGVYKK